ncbi:LysR substrate-binding domain-containing protein [Saccharopolyspora sp. CA-218241]|uniref:LysR substrate-binding domain-containing protein n=1 Tax=Saccharopolyspora sp. CA-218241 TaxID=3240027 RepID=UPI003D97773E
MHGCVASWCPPKYPLGTLVYRTVLGAAAPKAVIPENHPLAPRTTSLELLASEPFLLFDLAPAGEYFSGLFEDRDLHPRIRFRTRSHQLLLDLVAQGLGCSVVSQAAAAPAGVVVKDLADELRPLPILALSGARVRLTRRAETFIEHCRAALSSQGSRR